MKKYFILIMVAFLSEAVVAQQVKTGNGIDRTKPPKAGRAPVIKIGDPVIYTLQNGIKVLVVENHKAPKIEAAYFIDRGPVLEGGKAGVTALMGAMLGEGTGKHSKEEFYAEAEQAGSNVSFSETGGSLSALTRNFDQSFALLAEGLQQPSFPEAAFVKLKSQTITGLKSNEKNVAAVSDRVQEALLYGKNTAVGEFPTEASVEGLTHNDVKQAYNRNITPSRGYLTFMGDITPGKARELAEKYFGSWKGVSLTYPVIPPVSNPPATEVDLVDMPNAVQSEIAVVNLISLKPGNPDYFPLLIANNILGGGAEARLFKNLREKHGFTYGAYSGFSTGRNQTSFKAKAGVRNEKTDSAVMEFLTEIQRMRTEKVSDEELKNAKALYNGNFALGTEEPGTIARYAANILINDLPRDYYRTYLQKVNAVTAGDVLRVAAKYFNYDNTRIIVTGKGEDVLPGLKKLGYAVKQFDRFADPLPDHPGAAMPANVKAADIVAKYISVTGGEAALKKVNAVLMNGTITIQGTKLNMVMKQMLPNLSSSVITMNGNVVMKYVFNGNTGYQEQMGKKKELTAEEIADAKEESVFPQLNYNNGHYKLEIKGIAKIDGKEAYKLAVTNSSGIARIEYYDVATGYLVKKETSATREGQNILQVTSYGNYGKTGDISIAATISNTIQMAAGSQEYTIEFSDIKLNEKFSAVDFE